MAEPRTHATQTRARVRARARVRVRVRVRVPGKVKESDVPGVAAVCAVCRGLQSWLATVVGRACPPEEQQDGGD